MRFKLIYFLFFIGSFSIAQEWDNPNIFAVNNQIVRADLYQGKAVSLSQFDGYIKPERYHFSIPQGNVFGEDDKGQINMLALAEAERWKKKSAITDMQFPTKQLQQINGNIRVLYGNRENFRYRTNFNMDYYGQGTPDGGIRNEVYQDVTQPTINPYYFNNGGYYYPYRRTNSRGSNFNFYISR